MRWPVSCRLGRCPRACGIVASTRYEQRRFLPGNEAAAGGDDIIGLLLSNERRKSGHVELRLVRQWSACGQVVVVTPGTCIVSGQKTR